MMQGDQKITQDLLLIGGGHAHVVALMMLSAKALEGVRITLISNTCLTPYSGMLPGLIAGHYTYDEVHIDLARLCRKLGVRFIEDTVQGLDLENQQVLCSAHPPFRYDVLSIDTGSSPANEHISGAALYAVGVKPVDTFLSSWQQLQSRILNCSDRGKQWDIALVGGGASGVEVTLAMQHALLNKLEEKGQAARLQFHLVSASQEILPNHNANVRARYQKFLDQRGVNVYHASRVNSVEEGLLHIEQKCSESKNLISLKVDEIVWAVSAGAPKWPSLAGLQCSEKGFIEVDACLQSLSHKHVFAAGDVADVLPYSRPKAGVFAVRQGKPLAENLVRALRSEPLKPFKPQRHFLSLVSTGDQYAVASRASWMLCGKWVWKWKDSIDRKFMRRFSELGRMSNVQSSPKTVTLEQAKSLHGQQDETLNSMRCGGCGAKVGQPILQRVLSELTKEFSDGQVNKVGSDDAAVFAVPANKLLVQSVDAFRRFIDDDFLFGKIAANHALGDIFAMGAQPHSAQAIVTLPFASEDIVEQQLLHLMKGASSVFNEVGVSLVGGHTAEGMELSLGFAVNGLIDEDKVLTKGGLKSGDQLILTKPLGTGALFAGDMRGLAQGLWIKQAIESMVQSNYAASEILHRFGVRSCTDVTGFGLAGHLMEMLQPSKCKAEIYLDRLPILAGTEELMSAGVFSTLHSQNKQIEPKMRAYIQLSGESSLMKKECLFDPQTAGGLLAGVAKDQVESCLSELNALGYGVSRVIGQVL